MPIGTNGEGLLHVHETAELLGRTEHQVRKRLRRGEIKGIRASGGCLVRETALPGATPVARASAPVAGGRE